MISSATSRDEFDACVIGGGFFGSMIAFHLASVRKLRVAVLEREPNLLNRASRNNQARVHGGYHYLRDMGTAVRSRASYKRFLKDFPEAMISNFDHYYAIAAKNSRTTPAQFEQWCERIGAPYQKASREIVHQFNSQLIEAVYQVDETAFDAVKLRGILQERMNDYRIQTFFDHEVSNLTSKPDGTLLATVHSGSEFQIGARTVILCAYSATNEILKRCHLPLLPIDWHLAEMALVDRVPSLEFTATVMDGPYFSYFPYPAENLYSLSHVSYTPHGWPLASDGTILPWPLIPPSTHFERMRSDAERYLPGLKDLVHRRSIFEYKAFPRGVESSDGRPICLFSHHGLSNLHVVCGGKLDNIYDVLEALDPVLGEAMPIGLDKVGI